MLLQGGQVLEVRKGREASISRVDLRIEADRITELAADLAAKDGEEVISARDCLVVPGFVNAHMHSSEVFFKGRYDNLPLELWMLKAYPIIEARSLSPELVYLRTLLAGLETLKGGVTCVVDDVIEMAGQSHEHLGAVFDAYDDLGIRANVSGHVINRRFVDTIPFARDLLPAELLERVDSVVPISTSEYVDFSRAAIAEFQGRSGRLSYMLAPSGPQRCTDDLLVAAAALARASGLQYHIHVLETKVQAATGLVMYGTTLVEHLYDLGVLGPNVTLAHGIWVTDRDISLLAESQCSISHNPISNLKLGAGRAPFRRLVDAGINVGLGSDGLSSSDSSRMFDVVKAAALMPNVADSDFSSWPNASEVLWAVTGGGATSAGLGHEVGALDVGKKADLMILDLHTVPFTPLNDVRNHLVYSENGTSIKAVVVNGDVVVSDGKSTRVDEEDLLSRVRAAMPDVLAEHSQVELMNEAFAPAFEQVYRRCSSMPFDAGVGIVV